MPRPLNPERQAMYIESCNRQAKKRKASKYKNQRTVVDGIKYDSVGEANRHQALKLMEKAGLIKELSRQVSFILRPGVELFGKKKRALIYRADFSYVENGKKVIEDFKGRMTKEFIVKAHILKADFNIDIRITK